ncbi:MAG: NUDIX domain-containing protein [Paenibacillaceae bacterium]
MDNKIVVAVKAILVNKGKILIVKRADNDAVGAGEWETVGGKIDFGEKLEEALIREAKEESGLDIYVEKLLYAGTFMTNPNRQMVVITYLCRTEQDQVVLSDEHSDYVWANEDQLQQLLPPDILADFEKHKILILMKE